jgi:peptidoglycan/LPS O-acetylase OafA/YrhL
VYRIKRLYPQYIIALLICIFCMRFSGVLGISNQWSISSIKAWIIEYGFKEILMIHFWPWGTEYWHIANIPTWYISVMFIFQFNSIWIV